MILKQHCWGHCSVIRFMLLGNIRIPVICVVSSTGHAHTPSPRSPGEGGSGTLRPVRPALLKLRQWWALICGIWWVFLFSAGTSCSSSTQTAGAGSGAEERRGRDHSGVSTFYKIDVTIHAWMRRVNSITCRVDIQELFNEDMDAQADHYLMWSHAFFFSFFRAISNTRGFTRAAKRL